MIDPLTLIAALIVILILALLFDRRRYRRDDGIDDAIAEYCVALCFVRDEMCEMPHEFAACFLAGNRLAMEHKFPGFFEYRALCITDARRDHTCQEAAE